jgi:hypothetical protein
MSFEEHRGHEVTDNPLAGQDSQSAVVDTTATEAGGVEVQVGSAQKVLDVPAPEVKRLLRKFVQTVLVPRPGVPVAICLSIVAAAAVFAGELHEKGDEFIQNASNLDWITILCKVVAMVFLSLPVASLRRIACEGGALDQLRIRLDGSGSPQMVRPGRLKLMRCIELVGGFFFLLFLVIFVIGTTMGTSMGVVAGTATMLHITVFLPMLFAWVHCVTFACLLASSAIGEAIDAIERLTPGHPRWRDEVEQPLKLLCDKILPPLSTGLSDGLAGATLWTWAITASGLASFFQKDYRSSLLGATITCCIPLVLAQDIAAASSKCDAIHTALNRKRKQDLDNLEAHIVIDKLETMLNMENNKQGLGFVIFGIVCDRKTFRKIFGVIVSIISTVLPYLLLMSSRGLVGERPVHVLADVYQMPSGQFCTVDVTTLRNFSAAEDYCVGRGMRMAAVHSRADADAIEHLLVEPTFLGATKTGWAGEWRWLDGSPWDFVHSSSELNRAWEEKLDDGRLVAVIDGPNIQLLDPSTGVGYLAMVPSGYRPNGIPMRKWVSWAGYTPGDRPLHVACCAPRPSTLEFCAAIRRSDQGVSWSAEANVCEMY